MSALTENSIDIFTDVVLDFIAWPRKLPGAPAPGLERTQLHVDPHVVLAEAWLMAQIHGAMFHTAAHRHFEGHLPQGTPHHPGLPTSPTPDALLTHATAGTRFALTTDARGQIQRSSGLVTVDDVLVPMRVVRRGRGRVVDG